MLLVLPEPGAGPPRLTVTAAAVSPGRIGDMVSVRELGRPVRLIEPVGAIPFWDLLRQKSELLPS